MKLRTLELKGIRNFSQKRVDFTDNLNVLYGPNESGKSTILDCLVASLSKPTPEEISSLKQWDALHSEIKLTYTTDSSTFTVTRTLHPVVRDILEGNELLVEDPEKIQALLEEHTGISDKEIFENSVVVKQNEMQILQEENARAKVRQQVRTLLSGVPKRSTDEALEFLTKAISEAESSLEEIEKRTRAIENELQQYREIDAEFQDLKTREKIYENDLARDQSLLSGYETLLRYRNVESETKVLLKTVEEVENLEHYMRKLPVREKELVQSLQEELERISIHQDTLIEKRTKTQQELTKQRTVLSSIDDELEGIQSQKKGIFARLASLLKSSKERREELAAKRVEISQNVARLEDLMERHDEQISEWRRKFQEKGEQLKELMEQCTEYENWTIDMLEARRKEYESKIDGLLQGRSKESLKEIVQAKQREADELRAKLSLNYSELRDRKDVERISIEKEKLSEIIAEWKEKIAGLKARLELLSSRVQKRGALMQELEKLRREKEEKTLQMKADEIAQDVIALVYRELKEKFAPELEQRAGVFLSRITKGRYANIVVKKDDLDVLVKVPEKHGPVNVEVLSQGTRDQLYLSLRIALSELLSGDKNPPLLFDEAFYTFDDERLRETLIILREIAKTTQVIVFTHDESYAQYGHPIPLKRTV